MDTSHVMARAERLTALYREQLQELEGPLRGFFRGAEVALDLIYETRKNPDQVERGKMYLKVLMELLSVSEYTLQHFTVAELAAADKDGTLVRSCRA